MVIGFAMSPMMKNRPYRLRDIVRRHGAGFVIGALLTCMAVLIQLGLPFIVRYLIDELTEGTLTRRALMQGVLFYAACIPFAATLSYWMRRLPLRAAHTVEYAVRRDLFAHLARQDAGFFRRQRIGDLMTRMTSDLTVIRDALGHGVLHGVRSLVALLVAFSVLFRMQTGLGAILLALMFGMVMSFALLIRAIRRRHTALQEQTSDLGHTVEETFSGIRTIKGYALEKSRRRRFAHENRGMHQRAMGVSFVSEPIWPLFAFWFSLQLVATLVYGGHLVLQEQITLGDLVLVNQYLLYMQWPVLSLGWIGNLIQRGRTSWYRLLTLFATPPAIADNEQTDAGIQTLRGDIAFRDVGLQREGKMVLDGINLRIPAGSTIGITGPSGAGKTMLVSLVARLCDPDHGNIYIDNHLLSTIPLDVLRRHIGFAPQETMLFSETLAHNLAFGLPSLQEDVIRWAARIAHLDADIARFPNGYETHVGERGVTLSGGQRQRASLGRAVARKPAVLVLDDVLAAVDIQTESAILDNLTPVAQTRTTLLVSHRLSALYRADSIIVLENGRITEQGTHAELLARNGYYARTYRLQQFEAYASGHREGTHA